MMCLQGRFVCLEHQANSQGDPGHGQGHAERKLRHELTQGQLPPVPAIL